MIPQERINQNCQLVPSDGHLGVWMLKESTHISSHQGLTAKRQCTHHGDGGFQVRPLSIVIPCPNGTVLVGANEEGSGKNEWPVTRRSFLQTLEGSSVNIVSVHVVHITMLNHPIGMHCISWHRHLWTVKHRGLVHVVPNVGVSVGTSVLVQRKLRTPVLSHRRISKVWVQGCSWPTPPFEVGQLRGRVIHLSRVPRTLVSWVVNLGSNPWPVFFGIPLRRLCS
mmetsp:Transcript_68023/g.106829  ORF Transcript_68023/g.106829 Transcript_68023/m.106829 type:complete len:224 (-) Transcript_68023:1211-1882(-)